MQFLNKNISQLKGRTVAAVLVWGLVVFVALGVAGKAGSTNAASDPAKINGVWNGELVERDADGNSKSHVDLYLRLEQTGNVIKGVIGEDEASASAINDAVMSGNHLKFSAQAPGGPKGPVTWVLDLDVAAHGNEMTGHGHAVRKADNHWWEAEARFSRQQ